MTDLLVVGRSGQLAVELLALAAERGMSATALGRAELDLADPAADFTGLLAEHRPALVVNAAAYTAVDRAEEEPDAAHALNSDGPGRLAAACAAAGAPLVNVSTDYVFDGAGGPYAEDAPTAPTGAYGASKLAGERAVTAAGGRAVTLRTSWVYAAHGANFVRTMLRLAGDRAEIGVVADQHGRPTWARDLAEACLAAGDALQAGRLRAPVLHVAGGGECSWAEFAEAVFAGSAERGGPVARVRRITTAEYPTRARRPADSRLDTALAERTLAWSPLPWREALGLCLDQLAAEQGWTAPAHAG